LDSINSLDQNLFLVNLSILFPYEDPENLRFTVARIPDRACNPASGIAEERQVYYAALLQLKPSSGNAKKGLENPAILLRKGPAVPYFSPPVLDPKANNNKPRYAASFGSRDAPTEEMEIKKVKERAISLLMSDLEEEVHKHIAGDSAVPSEDGSMKSGKLGDSDKRRGSGSSSSWFSKSWN